MFPTKPIVIVAVALALTAPVFSQVCGGGPCYEVHPGPGCDHPECCALVCELLPYCCESGWDESCLQQAEFSCKPLGVCGLSTAGSCFEVHGNPACSDPDCCSAVCAVDPPCCETQWDSQCVQRALLSCSTPGECGSSIDSCFVVHPSGGCNDVECCDIICGFDPHCCQQAWDQVCVSAANCYCAGGCNVSCPANALQELEICGQKKNDPCYNPGGSIQGQSLIPTIPMCGTLFVTQPEGGSVDADVDVFVAQLGTAGSGMVTVTLSLTSKHRAWAALVPAPPIGGCNPLTSAVADVSSVNTLVGSQMICVPAGKYWVVVSAGIFPEIGQGELFPCAEGKYLVSAPYTTGCAGTCGSPSVSCFVPHESPGCGDPIGCCEAVCGADPFCCQVQWDNACAISAANACGAPPPDNDACADAQKVGEGSHFFTSIGATTDGPALTEACADETPPSFTKDVWFRFEPSTPGLVTASTCADSSFDSRLALYRGDCAALEFIACSDDDPACRIGPFGSVTFAASCDEVYFIRIGGKSGAAGTGELVIEELGSGSCGCAADLNGDDLVDGADITGLLGNWGNPGMGDLNLDGTVDGGDLTVLLGSWGPC